MSYEIKYPVRVEPQLARVPYIVDRNAKILCDASNGFDSDGSRLESVRDALNAAHSDRERLAAMEADWAEVHRMIRRAKESGNGEMLEQALDIAAKHAPPVKVEPDEADDPFIDAVLSASQKMRDALLLGKFDMLNVAVKEYDAAMEAVNVRDNLADAAVRGGGA